MRATWVWAPFLVAASLVGGGGLTACGDGDLGVGRGDGGGGGGDGGSNSLDGGTGGRDGTMTSSDGGPRDVGPNLDAFFADDPPPMYCGPDGGAGPAPEPPGGTPECPDDKNREGCRCDNVGDTAPCWPGLRANRDRGICQDGTTTCEEFDEFTGRWGPCMGYVLPQEGVTVGAGACGCFSNGRWEIENLNPCFAFQGAVEDGIVSGAVATYLDADGVAQCPDDAPQPQPGTVWSANRLTVDCEGRFELCYTLKAGDVDDPQPTDCVVARVCTEGWYAERDVPQDLPPLPSWMGDDRECAQSFVDSGGYGEMSVLGRSVECDPVDDGSGGEYVFNRVNYCPLCCNTGECASDPICDTCMMGGSGNF